MIKTAVFSPDRQHRYGLWRIWDEGKPPCMFIGLNPSTADENRDDPTVRRCLGYAGKWGYGGLVMTNIFAYRSTDPRKLLKIPDPIGPDNDIWLEFLAKNSGIIIAAWGNWGRLLNRGKEVSQLIPKLHCLGCTNSKQPRHPLYLSVNAIPELFMV